MYFKTVQINSLYQEKLIYANMFPQITMNVYEHQMKEYLDVLGEFSLDKEFENMVIAHIEKKLTPMPVSLFKGLIETALEDFVEKGLIGFMNCDYHNNNSFHLKTGFIVSSEKTEEKTIYEFVLEIGKQEETIEDESFDQEKADIKENITHSDSVFKTEEI